MAVHEVVLDHTIKEVCAINGGNSGGNQVNNKFVELLKEILGADFVHQYQTKSPDQWLSFLLRFENAKKKVQRDRRGKMRVELPFGMDKDFETI